MSTPNHLASANQEIASRIARQMYRPGCGAELDDLTSEAYVGLVQASQRFDPDRGVPFSAYAIISIRGRILGFLRKQWREQSKRERLRILSRRTTPDDERRQAERIDDVRDAIDQLCNTQEAAILRSMLAGRTYRDAPQLGLSCDQYYYHRRRAFAKVRQAVCTQQLEPSA
jgi:RNA polymerase sigma factor (sigma-70 family)